MGVEFVRDVPDTYGPRTRDLSFPFIALLHQGLMVEPSFISTQKGLTRFLEQYKGMLLQYILHRNSNMHSRRYL